MNLLANLSHVWKEMEERERGRRRVFALFLSSPPILAARHGEELQGCSLPHFMLSRWFDFVSRVPSHTEEKREKSSVY